MGLCDYARACASAPLADRESLVDLSNSENKTRQTVEPPSVFYPLSRGRQGASYPFAYTIEGTNFKISPALTGDAKLIYYAKAAALAADPDTNVILERWPGVYLFGCQIETYRIQRNDEEMAKALHMYSDAVTAANNQAIAARTFGGPLRKRVGFGV